jgi:hypothetical protein
MKLTIRRLHPEEIRNLPKSYCVCGHAPGQHNRENRVCDYHRYACLCDGFKRRPA